MLKATAHLLAIVVCTIFLTSCNSPIKIYKMDVEQGNHITKNAAQQLRPNMTKQEVLKIMGSPTLKSALDKNRWDYCYCLTKNDNNSCIKKKISVFFKNNKLSHLERSI